MTLTYSSDVEYDDQPPIPEEWIDNTLALLTSDIDVDPPELDQLPAYAPPAASRSQARNTAIQPVEHKIELVQNNGRVWLTLRLKSGARSSSSLPSIFEGQPLTGVVDLDLKKPDSISSVEIMISGVVFIALTGETFPFLEANHTVWDTTFGDPKTPDQWLVGVTGESGESAKFTEKLVGNYSLPFSFHMPRETNVNPKQLKKIQLAEQVALPPYLAERGCYSRFSYELAVIVKYSGIFRSKEHLCTSFGYTPRSRPDPPSALRQLSYQEGLPVLGPYEDPEGWELSSPVTIHGKLFNSRDVEMRCTVGVAKPLSYTRGTAIPCVLILEGEDSQLLELFSSKNADTLQLFRILNSRITPETVGGRSSLDRAKSGRSISRSRWFPCESPIGSTDAVASQRRVMLGEIHIPGGARPSFTFSRAYVKYVVRLVPSAVLGFVPAKNSATIDMDVIVNTDFAVGPRSRAYLAPAYSGTS